MSSPTSPTNWLLAVIRSMNGLATSFGSPEDAGILLAYMAAAFPNRPEVTVAQVRLLLLRDNHSEARSMLADAERSHPTNSVIKAMTALCLYMQSDPLWQAYAEEAAALPPTPITKALVERLAKASGKAIGSAAPGGEPAPATMDYQMFQGLAC